MKKITLLVLLFQVTLSNAQWTQQTLNEPAGPFFDMYLFDANTVCAVGQFMMAYKTSDGGANWMNYGPTGSNDWFTNVDFTDVNTGYACTLNGSIFKTTNAGLSWAQVGTNFQPLYSLNFINATTGYAVGLTGNLLKTINAGLTWNYVTYISSQQLLQIYFFNATIGYIVGYGGVIYKTNDGGASWTTLISNTTQNLNSIYFADVNVGWAIGDNGTIVKTTNGGATWVVQSSTVTNGLSGIYAINATTAYVVGASGTILYTTNGGTTWTPQASGTTNDLAEVKFFNATTGYIVGGWGTILKTTNGGLSTNDNKFLVRNVTAYPNPFNDSFKIKIDSDENLSNATVTIFDFIGNKVVEITDLQTNEICIKRNNLNSGIYFYYVKDNDMLIAKGKVIAQ